MTAAYFSWRKPRGDQRRRVHLASTASSTGMVSMCGADLGTVSAFAWEDVHHSARCRLCTRAANTGEPLRRYR